MWFKIQMFILHHINNSSQYKLQSIKEPPIICRKQRYDQSVLCLLYPCTLDWMVAHKVYKIGWKCGDNQSAKKMLNV